MPGNPITITQTSSSNQQVVAAYVKGPGGFSFDQGLYNNYSVSFTAPATSGDYSIDFKIPNGNLSNDYSHHFNISVIATSNSCAIFSTQNQCTQLSGCSWDNACGTGEPMTLSVKANTRNPETIFKGGKARITWRSENTKICECKYLSKLDVLTPCGSGIDGDQGGEEITLEESRTFTVNCSNSIGVTTGVNPPSIPTPYYYYRLTRCNGEIYETGPLISGTYSSGDGVYGAIEGDPNYFYT